MINVLNFPKVKINEIHRGEVFFYFPMEKEGGGLEIHILWKRDPYMSFNLSKGGVDTGWGSDTTIRKVGLVNNRDKVIDILRGK